MITIDSIISATSEVEELFGSNCVAFTLLWFASILSHHLIKEKQTHQTSANRLQTPTGTCRGGQKE